MTSLAPPQAIFNPPWYSNPYTTMHPIPPALYDDIASALLSTSLSRSSIARKMGCSPSTITSVAKNVVPDKENHHGGRPKKLSATDQRAIRAQVNLGKAGKADNAVEITREVNQALEDPVHPQTVRNVLKAGNFAAYIKQDRPKLQPRHIKARLDFALKHQHWTVDDWKRVIWSDETKINRIASDGKEYVWQKKGKQLNNKRVKDTMKFGGGFYYGLGMHGLAGSGIYGGGRGKDGCQAVYFHIG